MASRNMRTAPATDNRAQSAVVGKIPEPSLIDIAALTSGDNVVEGRSPEFSTAEIVMADPDVAPTQKPAPSGQPEPAPVPAAPVPAEPPAVPAAPVQAKDDGDKYEKMSPEELRKVARNQESMIGRQSEEVGTYRKLFDKMVTTGGPAPLTAPNAQPSGVPTAGDVGKWLKPHLSETEKQELIALALTDPEKHEEITYHRMRVRMDAEHRQRALMEEAEKVRDIVTTPAFQEYEKTLPPALIQSALSDPNALRWVIQQFQGRSEPPTAAPAPAPAPVAPAAPAPTRAVRLGTAAGVPSAGGAPSSLAPTFTRAQLMQMMTENPQEYAARQPEILQAYREGRVR